MIHLKYSKEQRSEFESPKLMWKVWWGHTRLQPQCSIGKPLEFSGCSLAPGSMWEILSQGNQVENDRVEHPVFPWPPSMYKHMHVQETHRHTTTTQHTHTNSKFVFWEHLPPCNFTSWLVIRDWDVRLILEWCSHITDCSHHEKKR